MFRTPVKSNERPAVTIVTPDAALENRLRTLLAGSGQFLVNSIHKAAGNASAALQSAPPGSALLVDIGPTNDVAGLEQLLSGLRQSTRVIVLTEGVAEAVVRRLVRLQITDWLTRDATASDLTQAMEHVFAPAPATAVRRGASCVGFMSAIGGAGSSTLVLAALPVIAKQKSMSLQSMCVVDLDFQSSAVCDYLDAAPNLQLAEIVAAPDRLDGHLLDIMLTRHPKGFSILAASGGTAAGTITTDVVGRLLDLAAAKFEYVVVDVPRAWSPWTRNVVRGLDDFRIVTELTVVGLRQARRLADVVEAECAMSLAGAVIVNKAPWLGGGVKRSVATDVLGNRLAGFIRDDERTARDAQNRGLMLGDVRKSNHIHSGLEVILKQARPSLP